MEYYVEYKQIGEVGWQRFNDTPFDVDCCAVDVAKNLMRLTVTIREVRVLKLEPTEIWRNGYPE